MQERICPVCGASFTPTYPNQVCCPPTDEDRKRPGQARSRCVVAYKNARQRGTLDQLLARAVRPAQPFDCAHCGEHCIPGENVASHATKFCGKGCKAAWHAAHRPWVPSPETQALRRAARRRMAAQRELRKAASLPSTGAVWTMGWCECGEPFISRQSAAVVCSQLCAKRRGRRAYRAKHGSYEHRRRARRFGVAYEPINPREVFEAANWICGICGEPTDPEADACQPRSASLDHIVPISRGGPHLQNNVQCAHFECNCLKADALTA